MYSNLANLASLIPSPSQHISVSSIASVKGFFKKAWQNSLNLAESLIQFTANDCRFQKTHKNQPNHSRACIEEEKPQIEQNGNDQIITRKNMEQSILGKNDFQISHDLSQLFQSTNSHQIQNKERITLVKRRKQQQLKILVIPDKEGRINVKHLLNKLQQQKQQKIQKQQLKITRSQFQFYQSPSKHSQLQGKTLNDIFKLHSHQNESQSITHKKQNQSIINDNQSLEKTTIKGSCSQNEEKMINQNKTQPIVFKGDLSTVLQSSSSDIQQDKNKQIIKPFLSEIKDSKEKAKKVGEEKGEKNQEENRIKQNPFLKGLKDISDNKLANDEFKTRLIQKMRNKLFDTAFRVKQTHNNDFVQTKVFKNNPHENNQSEKTENVNPFILSADQKMNGQHNFKNQFPYLISQRNIESNQSFTTQEFQIQTTNQVQFIKQSSNFNNQGFKSKAVQKQETKNSNQRQQTFSFTKISTNNFEQSPLFPNDSSKNVKLTPYNQHFLTDEKNKIIFNSFMQSNKNQSYVFTSQKQGSLFGEKEESERINGERKGERKSRLQGKGKKRVKREQRIRG